MLCLQGALGGGNGNGRSRNRMRGFVFSRGRIKPCQLVKPRRDMAALLRCAPKSHVATDALPPPPLLTLVISGYFRDQEGSGWLFERGGVVQYILDVRVGCEHFRVLRRFSDFRALHRLVARWLGLEQPFFLPRLLRHPRAQLERRAFMLQGYLDDLVAHAASAPASSDGAPLVLAGFLGLDAATAARALVVGCPAAPTRRALRGDGTCDLPGVRSLGGWPLRQKGLTTKLALSRVTSSASSGTSTTTTSFPAPLAPCSAAFARPLAATAIPPGPVVPTGPGRVLPAAGASGSGSRARPAWWHPLGAWVLRKLTGGVAVLSPGGEMRVDRVTLEAELLEWAVGRMLCGMPLPMKLASARVDSVVVTMRNGDLQVCGPRGG